MIVFKLAQLLNTPNPIVITESGTINESKLIQFAKAYCSISIKFFNAFVLTVERLVQFAKAYSSILSIGLPKVSVVKLVQPSNM